MIEIHYLHKDVIRAAHGYASSHQIVVLGDDGYAFTLPELSVNYLDSPGIQIRSMCYIPHGAPLDHDLRIVLEGVGHIEYVVPEQLILALPGQFYHSREILQCYAPILGEWTG